jgi:DNA repair protein RAD5
MDTPHPDERPLKKRRFFAENSSPAHVAPVRPASPQSSVRSATRPLEADAVHGRAHNAEGLDDFDVGTLQVIIGEQPASTLQKLKAVSGGDVQRGR